MPTFPIAIRNAQLDHHNAQTLARITAETTTQDRPILARGLGDHKALRGIPAIGRGVAGAIHGTAPGRLTTR